MPLDVRSRRGIDGAVGHLADLLDSTNAIVPARTATAIGRWRRLSATLRDYPIPPVGPARGTAIGALIEAADAETIDVDHVIGSKLLEEVHRHERAEAFRAVLTDATNAACSGVLGAANADEGQIVVAAQSRYRVLVAELITAATTLPDGFGERDALYANDQLREAWTAAGRAWTEMTSLRELVSTFDDFRDLDADWSRAIWTKSSRYADSVLFREQRSTLGEVGSLDFGLSLARECRDNPAELWLPTARQASDLAHRLWSSGATASIKLAAS